MYFLPEFGQDADFSQEAISRLFEVFTFCLERPANTDEGKSVILPLNANFLNLSFSASPYVFENAQWKNIILVELEMLITLAHTWVRYLESLCLDICVEVDPEMTVFDNN